MIAHATNTFDKACQFMECTLRCIADRERCARLLLAFVHKFPSIKTRCREFAMRFSCKRIGHHGKCDDFDEAAEVSRCLVRCRNCCVMLMKVQDCDVVDCVCGFHMS